MEPVAIVALPQLVGRHEAVSEWLQITQERVNQFADATGDHQWIHVDVERANRELGGTIAHGYLTLSLIALLSRGLIPFADLKRGLNYGSDKIRYINTVRTGQRIRLRQRLIGADQKAGGMLIRNECTIEIENEEKPACIAETLTLLFA